MTPGDRRDAVAAMTRTGVSRHALPSHVLPRHAGATPRAATTPSRVVPELFAELVVGPAVAQDTSHAERDHADDRPSAVRV